MPDEEEDLADRARHWATLGLVALNVTVAVAMVMSGTSPFFASASQLQAAGAVDATAIWHGEVWRLLTACFVHVGIWHLGLNMWVLLQVGRALEEMIGGARTALIYAVSGVFGFAVSVILQPRITTGASGAVFGVVGALIALAVLIKHQKLGKMLLGALVPFVGATILLGVLVPMVDNTAHVGGLVMGFLLGWGLHAGDLPFGKDADGKPVVVKQSVKPDEDPLVTARRARTRLLGTVTLIASAAVFLVVVAYAARPIASPRYHVLEGIAALNKGALDVARAHARKASALASDDAATLVFAGRLQQEDPAATPEARAEGRRAVEEALRRFDDKDPTAGFERAVLELSLVGGEDDMPYTDARTTWVLCQAALDAATGRPAPILKNNCAWLLVKTPDPRVKNPALALDLARDAVAESGGTEASVVHTLAVALAETGDAREGLALLERLAVEGKSLGAISLDGERARLARMAEAQKSE